MELAALSIQDRIRTIVEELPILPLNSFSPEDSCPICLLSFSSILAEQETLRNGQNKVSDVDAQYSVSDPLASSSQLSGFDYTGITKLIGCGHIFCKRDLVEWIQNYHGNCPTCRNVFLDIIFPSDEDYESSDGGEYIPGAEDDEEEDFLDGAVDEFEFDVDETDMDLDLDDDRSFDEEDIEEECWLTDGSTLSDVDLASSLEEVVVAGEAEEPEISTSIDQDDASVEQSK